MAGGGYSRKQCLTLVVFALADFCSAICVSLQAPFYPMEAEKKGATATQYGLVFGVFELTVFIVSPIYGMQLNRVGPKLVFNLGIFTTAVCCILFGLLDKVNSTSVFIGLSFLVRIVEALGNAGFLIASFSIIAKEFPNNVATIFASLETCFGIGLIVGPTVGGVLYQLGGYPLPFMVLGSGLIVTALITLCILPSHGQDNNNNSKQGGVLRALRIPSLTVAAASIVCASFSLGFIQALLEPHMRRFALKPVVLGLVFIINGVVYAVCAPVWGWLCDNWLKPKTVTAISALLTIVGFCILGPLPFIPVQPTLVMVCVALLLHGLGFGGQVVAGFVDMHREAVNNGFPDNLDTYGMVSGMWTSMFALGAFAGPSLAGAFYDHFGFRNATLSVIVVHIVLFIVLLVFLRHGLCHSSRTGRFHKLPPSPPISRTPAHQPAVNGEAVRLVKCSLDSTYGSGVSDNSSGPEICVC